MKNRIIKFRAWDKINNNMLMHEQDNKLMIPCSLGVLWLNPSIKDNNYVIKKEHFVIMQFTGLQDKNGTDIYEGDRLKSTVDLSKKPFSTKGVVKFNEGYAQYGLVDNHGFYEFGDLIFIETKVIGNIYSNPELIETK